MDAHSNTRRTQQAVHALNAALSNPYGQPYQQSSSHYVQAYTQRTANMPATTASGYTLSSTYVPNPPLPHQPHAPRGSGNNNFRGSYSSRGVRGGSHAQRPQTQTHWYEPGNHRCTHEQCAFTGSKKSVETHMMDRHLIYPPGWDKEKRRSDWDADPSLKNGKPIPILGTNVILDTPDAIAAWIAERKKRWPSASRAEEKNKKLQDAIDRGELAASNPKLRGMKRRRTDDGTLGREQAGGHGRGRGAARGSGTRTRPPITVHALPKKPVALVSVKAEESDSEDSSSGSDMDVARDAISSKPPDTTDAVMEDVQVHGSMATNLFVSEQTEKDKTHETSKSPQKIQATLRKPILHPKAVPRNPFANRPSLLRNLLLPEIRMTISNLSQAIHFLVENDFLEDVELNPGDADNKNIEVIGEIEHENDSSGRSQKEGGRRGKDH